MKILRKLIGTISEILKNLRKIPENFWIISKKFGNLSRIFWSFKETSLKILQTFSEISRREILKKFHENYEKIL